MNEIDLGTRLILAVCLAFKMGAPPWKKEIMISLKWSLLCTLGALVLRADVKILRPSHKSFMEDESLGFEKKYQKSPFGRLFWWFKSS
ncbi:hypothetical protein [Bartonella sp. TS25HLJMH]|uniref:hypothetical protein n=1 Tax=Bartonella sp. TS25HLJMH TaxID=3243576 RepID=UPI0035D08582